MLWVHVFLVRILLVSPKLGAPQNQGSQFPTIKFGDSAVELFVFLVGFVGRHGKPIAFLGTNRIVKVMVVSFFLLSSRLFFQLSESCEQ